MQCFESGSRYIWSQDFGFLDPDQRVKNNVILSNLNLNDWNFFYYKFHDLWMVDQISAQKEKKLFDNCALLNKSVNL